jgi:hypothetical protein
VGFPALYMSGYGTSLSLLGLPDAGLVTQTEMALNARLIASAVRLPLIAVMFAGALPYFLADEWFTRGAGAAPGAYVVTKLCFLLSLVGAIALNPQRLFFLAIIVPAILLLFVVYGLFSRWVGRATGHPAVAAVANALAFGAFIAVTFPLVA